MAIEESELAARILPYIVSQIGARASAIGANTGGASGGGILSPTAAGAGLTYSSGVLNVGQGAGITVNPDDVALASSVAGDGLTYNAGVLNVGAGAGLSAAADAIALGTPSSLSVSSANSASGTTHTHAVTSSSNPGAAASLLASDASGYVQLVRIGTAVAPQLPMHSRNASGAQLRLDYDASNYADFTVGAGGNLTIAPVGDVVFAPAGDDINPQTTYRYNVGQPSLKYLTFHAAEAWFTTLVAEEHRSTVGGRQTIGPATELIAPLTATGTSYNTITVRTPTSASTAGGSVYQTIAHVGTNTAGASGAGGLASISRVGASRNDDYTTSLVVNRPTGTVDNNVLVCLVSWWDQTLTMPSGWTQQGSTATWSDSNGTKYSRVYTRVASSEPSTYTFGLDGINDISVVIMAYQNVNTTTPVDVTISSSTQSTASTSATATTVTTVNAGAMVLYLTAPIDDSAGATPVAAPSGFTETSTADTSIWVKSYAAERVYTSAGPTGNVTGTLSTGRQSTSWLLALRPASGSSNTAVSINVPSNTNGNTLIAMVAYSGTQVLTAAPGWTQLSTLAGVNGGFYLYRRTVATGDASSYTFTSDVSTGALYGWISEYSGVNTSATFVVSSRSNTASTTITSPNITPATTADMLLFAAAAMDTSAGSSTVTPPSGMTERADAGSGDIRAYLATELLASAAQSGNRTATISTSEASLCALISLTPALNTSTSSVTPAFPAGTTAGDVMIVMAAHAGTSTLTAPAGYTFAFRTTGVNGIVDYYYRAIVSGDVAQAWAINTNGALGVALTAFANVDTLAPFYVTGEYSTQSNTASTSMTAAGITTSVVNTVGLFIGAAIDGSAGSSTITPPSGMTERLDAGAGDIRLYVATEDVAAVGPTGNRVATISTSEASVGTYISLRPSAVAGSTIDVKHNNLNPGDILHLEARMRLEFMRVTSSYTVITGGYRYSVIRNLDGTGANAWESGDGVFNTQQPGNGWIEAYSQSSMQAQAIDYVFNDDGGVFSANLNMEPNWEWWATIPVTNDAVYFGVTGTAWSNIFAYTVQAVAGTSIGATLEYWNGSAWTAVVGYTETNWLNNGGAFSIVWNAASQTGWAATTVNSVSAYWVRYRVTGGTWTQTARNGLRRVNRGTRQWGPTITGWIRNTYTWNDFSPRWAIGNLDGLYDYGTQVYGFAAGDYNGAWISADATNGFRVMRGGTNRFQVDTSGNLYIRNAAGASVITMDSAGNADITGVLRLPGTGSGLSVGITPPTGPLVGTGIWLDRNGFYGLANNLQQISISSADGRLRAGAYVTLDASGITLSNGSSGGDVVPWAAAIKIGSGTLYGHAVGFPLSRYVSLLTEYGYTRLGSSVDGNRDTYLQIGGAFTTSINAARRLDFYANGTRHLEWEEETGVWSFVGTLTGTTPYSARVYHSANQSASDVAWTTLAFDSESFDTGSFHDTATNNSRLTVPVTGRYQITGNVTFAANGTGFRVIAIVVDGSTYSAIQSTNNIGGSDNTHLTITTTLNLTAGQYVQLQTYQNSGGALNVLRANDYSAIFSIARIA